LLIIVDASGYSASMFLWRCKAEWWYRGKALLHEQTPYGMHNLFASILY